MKKTISTILVAGAISASTFVAFAQSGATSTATKKVDIACLQAAIEKRDMSIASGISTMSSAITGALTTRKEALKVAVALPTKTETQAARKLANTAFDKTVKSARAAMKDSHSKVWSTYKTEAKSCGQKEVEAPTATESVL